ncbi:cytochrome c [Paraburkholderia sp. MPAMCS5]|uniref:c-type cytochrome n=1 Tax=Paraburkholderia sp. MPAMCS5 TaxID=3112563 RepID=UPI002E17E337|nr:cytochrome c [Paraburkholderia sp. MPAMCS5]
MTKNLSRARQARASVDALHARRRYRLATLAALFSLFALIVAWHEAQRPRHPHKDEMPITQAHADDASVAADSSGTPTPAADLVKRGEYLARVGDCAACHTADKTRPFAGGLAIETPFGTVVTPNITPDPDTGIGQWTDEDFLRAMHEGIGKSGERLYPVFPYVEYTKLAEHDVLAIRAYLNSLAPIHYTPPHSTVKFPFDQRWLMAVWNMFNFSEERFVPDPKQSAEWNRGAYLVEGLAHCGECHTPRNATYGLKADSRLSGAVLRGSRAYNITPDKTSGVGNWSDEELEKYLSTGAAPGRPTATGAMARVVENSTQYLTREDLRSIVQYLRSVPAISGGETRAHGQ